ncbi:MAG: agmatinase [Candidatus Eisenbacteria bacterium]|uniref:Agmatinase n=1 Tax=Eiseniibacteriota bacterium TaxID=2212470 RepID=A0A956RRZ6_UNCEI|nr:agmatinase [Candidatus Eisenbacteria bacterium]
MPKYHPPDAMVSPRICGVRTFMKLPHVVTTEDIDFAIVGIPFDTGATYRVGARFGPEAIRAGSTMLRPFNGILGVDIFEHLSGVDYGDVPVVPGDIQASYDTIVDGLSPLVDAGVTTIGLGGDHSITLAELRAISRKHGPLGMVQIDAHPDTWKGHWGQRYNHGTVFRRATEEGILDPSRVIQVGMRGSIYGWEDYEQSRQLGMELIPMHEVRDMGLPAVIQRMKDRVQDGPTFLTFDIDSLDPVYAPGTGTPEVGGFTSHEGLSLVRGLTGIDFVGADLVEVLPAYDHAEVTAMTAANVIFEFLSLLALRKKERSGK